MNPLAAPLPVRAPNSFDRVLACRLDNVKFADTEAEAGMFTGVASAVGVVDAHREVIAPGAFDATLQEKGNRFPLLWQHNWWEPIGVITLTVDPATGNLVGKGELNLETQLGREAHALLKQGAIGAMSIGFNIPEGSIAYDEQRGVHVISRVDLWETSVVTFPANPGAQIEDVKAAVAQVIKAGRVLSAANRAKVVAARDALQELLDAADAEKSKTAACPECGQPMRREDAADPDDDPADDEDPDEDDPPVEKSIGHHPASAELDAVKQFIDAMNNDLAGRRRPT